MPTEENHQPSAEGPSARGRAFLWGGLALGLLLIAGLLTHGFGLLAGSGKGDQAPAPMVHQGDKIFIPEGSALRQALAVMPAEAKPVNAKLTLPGTVESDPARTAVVLPALGGRLISLKARLGDRVVRGQILAVIDSPDLGQAYDDDAKAADTFHLTETNLERQEAQSKLGVLSDRDLDQARSDHAQAAAEYERTQARLKTLGVPLEPQGALGNGALRKGAPRLLTVIAPVSGSVTVLSVAEGAMINDPTQPIMTVADLSTVWVTALVAEKDMGLVYKDQDAQVTLLAYPDRLLSGKILFVSDVIESDSRRGKVRIAFANRDYALKPSMFATVTLTRPAATQVVLPSSALLMNNDRTTVFVATAPWTFERRTVDPQLEVGPSVAIRSGVAAGEPVVVKGGILLND